jgi:hypothetical protein
MLLYPDGTSTELWRVPHPAITAATAGDQFFYTTAPAATQPINVIEKLFTAAALVPPGVQYDNIPEPPAAELL